MQITAADGRPTAEVAAEFIKPNDRLTSFERIELYNKQYWFRLIDVFYEDYPGLAAILGEKRFNQLCKEYLVRYPSKSGLLRYLGRKLEDFIAEEPHLTAPQTEMALDMTRFEWAQLQAFDGAKKPPLTPDDLLGKDPAQTHLKMQPYLTLLHAKYAVDHLLIAVKKQELRGEASNASNGTSYTGKLPPIGQGRARLPRGASAGEHRLHQAARPRGVRDPRRDPRWRDAHRRDCRRNPGGCATGTVGCPTSGLVQKLDVVRLVLQAITTKSDQPVATAVGSMKQGLIMTTQSRPLDEGLLHKVTDTWAPKYLAIANSLQSLVLLFLRVTIAWQLAESGYSHLTHVQDMVERFRGWGVPFPLVNVYISGATELIGGTLLILGLGARFISLPLLFNFIVAYLTASRAVVKQVFTGPNHLEGYDAVINDAAFTMIVLSLSMLAFGAGRFSLDYLVSRMLTRRNHK